MTRLKVAIIGLGNIGFGYDKSLGEEIVLTHTKAFSVHTGYEIVAGFDLHAEKRNDFELNTGVPTYTYLSEFEGKCDVIIIATPPIDRQILVENCLLLKPRLIIIEKPIASSADEGEAIVKLCRNAGCELFVNYMRRCDPVVQDLKVDITNGKYGNFLGGHVLYTRGILNNASHFLDLFLFLIGTPQNQGVLNTGTPESLIEDPNIDFWIEFNEKRCLFQSISSNEFSIGSVQFFFSKACINYEDFGRNINLKYIEPDPHFEKFNRVTSKLEHLESDFHRIQWHLANHIFTHLIKGEKLLSNGESGLQTLKICEKLLELWQK